MTFRPASALVVGVSLLSLSACSMPWMPRGYTGQDDTPISTPAPTSPWSDKAFIENTDKIAASTAAWQGAVFELLDKVSAVIPRDGTPLIVTTTPPYAALDLSFDHYLRQGLMQKGYNLTTTSGSALLVVFNIEPLSNKKALELAKKDAGFVAPKDARLDGIYLLGLEIKKPDGKTVLGSGVTTAVIPYDKNTSETWQAGSSVGRPRGGYNK